MDLVFRSPPRVDCLPTLKTANSRICVTLPSGQFGMLRVEDAERAQVHFKTVALQECAILRSQAMDGLFDSIDHCICRYRGSQKGGQEVPQR